MKLVVKFKNQSFPNYYYDADVNVIYQRNISKDSVIETKYGVTPITLVCNDKPAEIDYDPIPRVVLDGNHYRLDYVIAYTMYGCPEGIIRLLHLDNDNQNCAWENLVWMTKSDVEEKYIDLYKVSDINDIPEVWKRYFLPLRADRIFEVSNLGRVRDENHNIREPRRDTGGYAVVGYNGPDNKPRTFFVHRAVAELFIDNPNPTEFTIVNHLDGDKLNNAVWNLEWVSESLNMEHAHLTELANSRQRYDEALIHEVCKALSRGVRVVDVAKEFGISPKFVSAIYTRKRWTSVSKDYIFPSKTFSEGDKNRIRCMIEDGLKGVEISRRLGVPYDNKFISLYERMRRKIRQDNRSKNDNV